VLIHPLWFDFQALWGWQQLLPWQRVKNESDHTFLNPTRQSARGSRRVCYGKASRLHADTLGCPLDPFPAPGVARPRAVQKLPSLGIFGASFLEPESYVLVCRNGSLAVLLVFNVMLQSPELT